jgi:Arc/MetJ-type ribon-helix-helix transcriptional regulator
MMTQAKFQIDREDYEFIKAAYKLLDYRNYSEYMREAVKEKIRADRKKLREIKRDLAMEQIGKASYGNHFDLLDGEDFEDR